MQSDEWIALFVFVHVTYGALWEMPASTPRGAFYAGLRKAIRKCYGGWLAPPPAVFSVWLVLYGLMAAAIHVFWMAAHAEDSDVEPHVLDRIMVVWGVTIVLLKMWSVLFAQRRLALAFAVVAASLATSVWLSAEFASGAHTLSLGLWLPLNAWLVYATLLAWASWRVTRT